MLVASSALFVAIRYNNVSEVTTKRHLSELHYGKPHGNRRAPFEKKKKYSYVHIPKCGGSSTIKVLNEIISNFVPTAKAGVERGAYFNMLNLP